RLEDIKYLSTKIGPWTEKWYNTSRPHNRLLVLHRRSGWFKYFAISPKSPYVLKAELDRARRALLPRPLEGVLGDTEVLSKSNVCHPFYTGQQKFVDTAGRVDKFQQRMAKTQAAQAAAAAPKKKKA